MNIGAPWPARPEAIERVLAMQTKLHRWAVLHRTLFKESPPVLGRTGSPVNRVGRWQSVSERQRDLSLLSTVA